MIFSKKSLKSFSDPLEQFENISWLDIELSNINYYVFFSGAFVCLFLLFNQSHPSYRGIKPNLVLFRDKTFIYIFNLLKANLNMKIVVFFPVIYLTFLCLLIANLIGMIPFSFTVTSSAAMSFFLAATFFFGVSFVGYSVHSDRLFQVLLPPGVPLKMAPFLIVIELLSYLARLFSLAIRLFANMLSGHGLLKVLGSLVWGVIFSLPAGFFLIYFLPPVVFAIVFVLEVFIAFLQTYVFLILVCIYLNDALFIH
jgi:ATP synthase subunit 6